MAFEASRSNRAFEVGGAIDIAGAVRPAAGCGPVGNGKFEELITAPIQVSLPFSAGTDDEINTLCSRFLRPTLPVIAVSKNASLFASMRKFTCGLSVDMVFLPEANLPRIVESLGSCDVRWWRVLLVALKFFHMTGLACRVANVSVGLGQ